MIVKMMGQNLEYDTVRDASQNAKQARRDATRAQSKRAATQSNIGAKCKQTSSLCYFFEKVAEKKNKQRMIQPERLQACF